MKHFLDVAVPNYKPLHRNTIARNIRTRYQLHRKKVKWILNKQKHIALTTDMWRNRAGYHFICITAHFLYKYEMVSLCLSFRRFYGRSLATRITRFINNEIEKNGIQDKITSITTGLFNKLLPVSDSIFSLLFYSKTLKIMDLI